MMYTICDRHPLVVDEKLFCRYYNYTSFNRGCLPFVKNLVFAHLIVKKMENIILD